MSSNEEEQSLIDRREAVKRVSFMLGGLALVGSGSGLLAACTPQDRAAATKAGAGAFSPDDIALLDEVADTILPDTAKSPGAKAAKTGAFMALMVTDTYSPEDQAIFRAGMTALDEASKKANNVGFVQATPAQRVALLTSLDLEQKRIADGREAADRKKKGLAPLAPAETAPSGDAHLPDERKEGAAGAESGGAAAITADTPQHYFRMMKELSMLGFFTSEIGYTKAMRYKESPGPFQPCVPYTKGDPAWAAHA